MISYDADAPSPTSTGRNGGGGLCTTNYNPRLCPRPGLPLVRWEAATRRYSMRWRRGTRVAVRLFVRVVHVALVIRVFFPFPSLGSGASYPSTAHTNTGAGGAKQRWRTLGGGGGGRAARGGGWFLDTPAAPFGVHRMALAGKATGKDVGMWFGPSAAAGAVRWVPLTLPVIPHPRPSSHRLSTYTHTRVTVPSHFSRPRFPAVAVVVELNAFDGDDCSSHSTYFYFALFHSTRVLMIPSSTHISASPPPYFSSLLSSPLSGLTTAVAAPSVSFSSAHLFENYRLTSSFPHRMLVDGFPSCGLGVSVAPDGTLYRTEVFAASHSPGARWSSQHSSASHSHAHRPHTKSWGDRPVLLLLGLRLGLDGVNLVYYETIKMLFTLPQSVGIAGGWSSSSYYFIGVQSDGLFYLNRHHSRPAIPLRPFIDPATTAPPATAQDDRRSLSPEAYARGGFMSPDFGLSFSQGQGAGQSPITEDELVIRPTSRRRGPLRTMTTIWGWRASRTPKRLRTPGLTTTTAMATPTSRVLRTPHTPCAAPRTSQPLTHARPPRLQLDHQDQQRRVQLGGGHGGGPRRPITPLPGARFDLSGGPAPAAANDNGNGTARPGEAYAELEGDDSFIDAGGEIWIEDEWVDPVGSPSPAAANAYPCARDCAAAAQEERVVNEQGEEHCLAAGARRRCPC
ncbi:hypothetical protein DFH07DRAFT_954710 [Mycena maculata]|uniref:Cysteine protease n=1 Tax=Mycena maculata TaxID=230809 RepID=A0AAD7JML4_9AGAR|nr:hypothetical protein DFH07DRAFT_954710 [Mycena maculata]